MLYNLQRGFQPTAGRRQLVSDAPRSAAASRRARAGRTPDIGTDLGRGNRIAPRICRHIIYLSKPQWQPKQSLKQLGFLSLCPRKVSPWATSELMGAKEVGEPLSINGQFGTITSPTDKCAMRISGIGPSFVGQYVPLQSITVPIILSCDVGRVLEAGPVQVKSGRSGQTVVNGTAMVLAIANNIFSPSQEPSQ